MGLGRYERARRPKRSEDEWHVLAEAAVLALLERERAVTVVEMEAKLADRTYDAVVCPDPINPHHLTNARRSLSGRGLIEQFTSPAKSKADSGASDMVTTWSLPRVYGRKTAIDRAAERKRALVARWLSWGHRHLIGQAGEDALAAALEDSPTLAYPSGSTRSVLGVAVGEVDNTAVYIERGDTGRLVPIQIMFEVKNTREHYYAGDEDVLNFLTKAAIVQQARLDQLVLPIFVCRRRHWTLWDQGVEIGFLPAMVREQLVKKDPDLGVDDWNSRFGEVRAELLPDLLALGPKRRTTNYHRGILNKSIPKNAMAYAARWRESHTEYLPS